MIRGNVLFEVEKIEQLALINRLTTHHDLRPSLKGSDDGIMIRQYPRGLFQQHRSKAVKLRTSICFPVYPQQRTFVSAIGTSVQVESRMGAVAWAMRQRAVS